MEEKIRLSPCPFCGSKGVIYAEIKEPKLGYGAYRYRVRCTRCGCTLERLNKGELLTTWNTRSAEK